MELIYRYDPFRPLTWSPPADSEAALGLLREGNNRFVEIVGRMHRTMLGEEDPSPMVIPFDLMSLGLSLVPDVAIDQAPFGLVVGCSDARAPVEQIFDQGSNKLFVVRIAGNVLGTECLGSVNFAVRKLTSTLKVVLVLGHSGCGAVTAAVETYLHPSEFAEIASTFALRSLVDRLMVAVRGAAKALQLEAGSSISKHPSYRTALVELAVYLNAAVTAFDLRRELAILNIPDMRVVYGVYDLEALRVHAEPDHYERGHKRAEQSFGEAPQQADQFGELARHLAQQVIALQLT